MARVLQLTLPPDSLHRAYRNLITDLESKSEVGGPILSTANALWGERSCPFKPSFVQIADEYYSAPLHTADFLDGAEDARQAINRWAEQATGGRVSDLLDTPGLVTSETALILTSAVDFEAPWSKPFDAASTQEARFYLGDGTSVQADMMSMADTCGYWGGDSLQVLKLDYVHAAYSMLILLPRRIDGLPELESSLRSETLSELGALLEGRRVSVTIPKFAFATPLRMSKCLRSMGMVLAFERFDADFSGMANVKTLWMDEVVHEARVDVNEHGTRAAASTAVVMSWGALKDVYGEGAVPRFCADHPFLFVILDRQSACILFVGRMVDPTS
jgi:serpin B